ncbi:MAG: alpha/beta fold hydrolase [Pseudomonadota bacterium]
MSSRSSTRSSARASGGGSSAAAVNLRRAYFDCRYGQLHVRTAFPNTGGFDERTTLLCLHQSPMSSRTFLPLLPEIGSDRSVYAPDTPGFGDSDVPPRQPSIADYAAAIGDLIDGLRLRQVDLLGYHTGSAIAAELAIARPTQVKRVAFVALPIFDREEREAFARQPWPVPVREDGGHLLAEWQRSVQWRGPGVTLEQLAESFGDKLRNGPRAWWGAHAAVHWPAAERLPLVTQPSLVLRPRDDLWEHTARGAALLKGARWHDLPERGFGLFATATAEIASLLRKFYD